MCYDFIFNLNIFTYTYTFIEHIGFLVLFTTFIMNTYMFIYIYILYMTLLTTRTLVCVLHQIYLRMLLGSGYWGRGRGTGRGRGVRIWISSALYMFIFIFIFYKNGYALERVCTRRLTSDIYSIWYHQWEAITKFTIYIYIEIDICYIRFIYYYCICIYTISRWLSFSLAVHIEAILRRTRYK